MNAGRVPICNADIPVKIVEQAYKDMFFSFTEEFRLEIESGKPDTGIPVPGVFQIKLALATGYINDKPSLLKMFNLTDLREWSDASSFRSALERLTGFHSSQFISLEGAVMREPGTVALLRRHRLIDAGIDPDTGEEIGKAQEKAQEKEKAEKGSGDDDGDDGGDLKERGEDHSKDDKDDLQNAAFGTILKSMKRL